MQIIFALCFADSICHLTHVASNVAIRVVLYQKLPGLRVLMKQEGIHYTSHYSNTAAWMHHRKAIFKLLPHFGLQWTALLLRSVLSRCR